MAAPRAQKKLTPAAMVASLLVALPLACLAQESSDSQPLQLEEVIVTAQKRSESLVEVPLGITSLSEEQLGILNAQSFSDYARSVPSLDFQDSGSTGNRGIRITAIRGVNGQAPRAPDTETVAFYINDTPIRAIDPSVLNLERIEVLRGPQGTLWGAGAMGGVVRLITRRADAGAEQASGAFGGGVSGTQHGATNYALNGHVNVPLSDTVAFTASAAGRQDSGYIDNVNVVTYPGILEPSFAKNEKNTNEARLYDFYGELRFTPSDGWDIAPNVLYHKGKQDSLGAFSEALGRKSLRTNFESPTGSSEEYYLAGLPVQVRFGSVTLFSSTSYFDYKDVDREDSTEGNVANFVPRLRIENPQFSFATVQKNNIDIKTFTQELRLASNDKQRIDWTLGAYYQDRSTQYNISERGEDWDEVATTDVYFGPDFLLIPDFPTNTQLVDIRNHYNLKETAGFGSATLNVTDRFHLTAGLRYSDIKRDTTNTRGVDFYQAAFGVPVGTERRKSSESSTTYRVSLAYDLTNDLNAYLTTATGYRPGGENFHSPLQIEVCGYKDSYKSDKINNYELGLKGTTPSKRLQFSSAVYRIDWKDIQQSYGVALGGCFSGSTGNFGKARISGLELEVNALATDRLSTGLSLSYTDSEFRTANPLISVEKGDRIPLISKWKLGGFGQLLVPLAGHEGYVRADAQYLSASTLGYVEQNYLGEPLANNKSAYTSLGASIGMRFEDGWDVKLAGTNLLDETPVLGGRMVGTNARRVNTLRPRTIGVSFTKSF